MNTNILILVVAIGFIVAFVVTVFAWFQFSFKKRLKVAKQEYNKQSILKRLNSLYLCLSAHPHNEPDSEFADRIADLEELIEHFKNGKELTFK